MFVRSAMGLYLIAITLVLGLHCTTTLGVATEDYPSQLRVEQFPFFCLHQEHHQSNRQFANGHVTFLISVAVVA